MMNNLNAIRKEFHKDTPLESVILNRMQFKKYGKVQKMRQTVREIKSGTRMICRVVSENIHLLSKAFKNQFVIPEFKHFCDQIETIYDRCKDNDDGNVGSSLC